MKVNIDNGIFHAVITENDHVEKCPFCGSDDIIVQNTWTASYWVECSDCGAEMHTQSSGDHDNKDHHLREARAALDAWNVRA